MGGIFMSGFTCFEMASRLMTKGRLEISSYLSLLLPLFYHLLIGGIFMSGFTYFEMASRLMTKGRLEISSYLSLLLPLFYHLLMVGNFYVWLYSF